MSTPKNNITRSVSPKSIFPDAIHVLDATVDFNQGDLLVYDATNDLLKVPSAESEAETFLGVAIETIVDGKLKRPYTTDVDASAAISSVPGPVYGVVVQVTLHTGNAVDPGDSVYLDPSAGAQHVQVTGTKPIGVYQGAAIASASAGQQIEVLLGCRYPNDTLSF